MIAEGRLLRLGSRALRDRVVALKRSGMRTEPAFAQLLGLGGDPYRAVLELEGESDEALRDRLRRAGLLR